MILNENQKEMYKDCIFLNESLFNKISVKDLSSAMDDYASIKKLPKYREIKIIRLENNSSTLNYINKHPELKKFLINDYERTHDEKPKSDKDLLEDFEGFYQFCFEYQNKIQFYTEFRGHKNSMQHSRFFNKIFAEYKNYVNAILYIKLVQEMNLKLSINVKAFMNEYKKLKDVK